MLGAVSGPVLLYSLLANAAEGRPAGIQCAALSVFGLSFCLWLLSVFTALPAG